MRNRRVMVVVAAAALAVVLAVGAAGSALAYGPFGPGPQSVQAQTPNGGQGQYQGWACPAARDPETAQAMWDAMQSGDYDKMRELMGSYGGWMGPWMHGGDWGQMQEWMQNGDWDAMRDYMWGQGAGSDWTPGSGSPATPNQGRPQTSAPTTGGFRGFGGGMMGGSNFGGMMGGR